MIHNKREQFTVEPGSSDDKPNLPILEAVKSLQKEVWIVYAIKYLESYSFFILAYTLVLYLSDEFHLGDEQAGWVYGVYGVLVSIYGLIMGTVIDALGVQRSLGIGLSMLVLSRIVLASTHSVVVLLTCLATLLPVGAALTLPVLTIGLKRYTNESNRTVAFSGYYIVMNLSAMTAAPCIDAFHRLLPSQLSFLGFSLTPYRALILVGSLLTLFSLTLTLLFIRDSPRSSPESSIDSFAHVLRSDRFWRFLLLTVLLLGVRTVYRHLDATFPKFMLRNFGRDAPYGSLIALNPLCVVLVTVITIPLGLLWHPVPIIIFGSFISALSPFAMTLGTNYTNCIAFVLLLSIGEGVWSPRLYEYTVMIAEHGREGTYMALAATPMFLATLITGATSGVLLDKYSPEIGPRRPQMLWMIVGCTAILSPVLLFLFRGVVMGETKD
jgi:predicted MFS family arabinose efflux permease